MRLLRSPVTVAASALLTLGVLAGWFYAAIGSWPPRHWPSATTYQRHGYRWRSHTIIRPRPARLVFEWWDVPPADDATFAVDVQTSSNHRLGADFAGGAGWNLLAAAGDSYAAGQGWTSGGRRTGRRGPFQVTGYTRVGFSWWFLALIASVPLWAPIVPRVFNAVVGTRARRGGFPLHSLGFRRRRDAVDGEDGDHLFAKADAPASEDELLEILRSET